MEKMFYSISETAEMLSESTSCIRFWTNSFPKKITPHRNAKGNRQYRPEDIEVLKQVQFLLKNRGMTIEGVAKELEGDTSATRKRMKALETLKSIREELAKIRAEL